jgi:hypothetical protein
MDKIKDNLPLVTLVLLLLGFARMVAFYKFFHVDIASFIDLTEVIQLQFEFYTIGFIFLSGALLQLLDWVGGLLSNQARVKALVETPTPELREKHPVIDRISKHILSILFGILGIATLTIQHFDGKKGFMGPLYADIFAVFFIAFVLSAYPLRSIVGIRKLRLLKDQHVPVVTGVILLGLLMVAAAIYSRASAFKIMTEQPDYEATLVLGDRTVVTNKNLIYVGKSKSYVFLYDKDTDQSEVIPTSDIKRMNFRPGLMNHKVPKPWRTESYRGPK